MCLSVVHRFRSNSSSQSGDLYDRSTWNKIFTLMKIKILIQALKLMMKSVIIKHDLNFLHVEMSSLFYRSALPTLETTLLVVGMDKELSHPGKEFYLSTSRRLSAEVSKWKKKRIVYKSPQFTLCKITHTLQIVLTLNPKMMSVLWAKKFNLILTNVILMSFLKYKPCHVLLKNRCPIKKSEM